MPISAKIIADSVNPARQRLTTFECTFNRYILAELNTHRVLSRNSASSRAIPVKRIISQVWRDPAVPVSFGENRAGMQARAELGRFRAWLCRRLFLLARVPAIVIAWSLSKLGLHKQVTNRILEPWVWHTAIVSSTEWKNFFKLRLHPDAQPEFQELARRMRWAMDASVPVEVPWGGWHLPYVHGTSSTPGEAIPNEARISAACCARVSYVRQLDKKSVDEDLSMCGRLADNGHYSPLEHPAQAVEGSADSNFRGFRQLRKFFPGEDGNS